MAVLSMSKQEFSRLEVLLRVQSGRLRVADACALIGLSGISPAAWPQAGWCPTGCGCCKPPWSVVGTAARRGSDAYQAIRAVLHGESVILPG
jgi:hypothetical protein